MLAELEFCPVFVPELRNTESRLLLLETPRYSKSSSVSLPPTGPSFFSKSANPPAPAPAAALDPNNFLNPPDFSVDSPSVSSAKSGSWLVNLLRRLFMKRKSTTNAPIKIVPPMDPTSPPINFALESELEELDELLLLDVAAVGTVTNVVMVVLGNTLTVE